MISGTGDKNSGTTGETFFQSALILAGKNPQQTIWPIKPSGTRIPLYLIPSLVHIPGDFNRLGGLLDADQPCYAFNLPIRKCRSDRAGLIKELAGLLADELHKFQPEGPVAIGGWSAGIVSALELAQQMKARGREVVVLLSFDSVPEIPASMTGRTPSPADLKFGLTIIKVRNARIPCPSWQKSLAQNPSRRS